jgi:transposase
MKKKEIYNSEEKTKILREHLEDNVSISDLAEKYSIHPNALYKWKKQLFEEAPQTLTRKNQKKGKHQSEYERRIAELEALLAKRESLITELVEDNIELKKNLIGKGLLSNGSSRRLGTR